MRSGKEVNKRKLRMAFREEEEEEEKEISVICKETEFK